MTQSIRNGDSVTRFGDTGHVTLTIENMPWINWHSVSTVSKIGIIRNFSTYYPSLGLALIRTIKIGTENFRNDEISWNLKCISH